MTKKRKYLLALGVGISVEAIFIALMVLEVLPEYIFYGLHPAMHLLQKLGTLAHNGVYTSMLILSALQYFAVAMAVIEIASFCHNHHLSNSSRAIFPSIFWGVASIAVISACTISYRAHKARHDAILFAHQARKIHLSVYSTMLDRTPIPMESAWPTDRFATSTSYFQYLIESKRLNIDDYNIFFVPSAHSKGAEGDTPELNSLNNAWAITLPYSPKRRPDNAPFLISRNIGFGDPPGPYQEGMTTADMSGLIADDPLLKGKYGVVFTYGGSLRLIPKSDARQETLNPSGHALPVLPP